jgi:hypothetical protein
MDRISRSDPMGFLNLTSTRLSNLVSDVPAVPLFELVLRAIPVPTRQCAWLALVCPVAWPNKSRFGGRSDCRREGEAGGGFSVVPGWYRACARRQIPGSGFGIAWSLFVHFESDVLHGIIVLHRGREWRPPERVRSLCSQQSLVTVCLPRSSSSNKRSGAELQPRLWM